MFVQAGFLIVFDNKDKPILVPAMSLSTDYVRVISRKRLLSVVGVMICRYIESMVNLPYI